MADQCVWAMLAEELSGRHTSHPGRKGCDIYLLMVSSDGLVEVGQPVHAAGQIYLDVPAVVLLHSVHGHVCGTHTAARCVPPDSAMMTSHRRSLAIRKLMQPMPPPYLLMAKLPP